MTALKCVLMYSLLKVCCGFLQLNYIRRSLGPLLLISHLLIVLECLIKHSIISFIAIMELKGQYLKIKYSNIRAAREHSADIVDRQSIKSTT